MIEILAIFTLSILFGLFASAPALARMIVHGTHGYPQRALRTAPKRQAR